jgi:hypothetical protein
MEQEPSQKFLGSYGHQPLLTFMGVIFPSKGNLAIGNVDDSVIGNRDAMRIAGQIVEDMFGSSEWPFSVDNPVVAKQRSQKLIERFLFGQPFHTASKPEFPLEESALQTGDELTAKDAAQHLDRQEERIARMDPALVVGRKAAGWDHAMDVRMRLKLLPPGMKHTQKTNLGSEMLGIGGNLHQSRSAGVEQEVVDDLLILQGQTRQLMRNREDNVHVFNGQQFLSAVGEPVVAGVGLAFWTMPRAAGVKRGSLKAALTTAIQVTTERRRSTVLDGEKDAEVKPRQPGSVLFDKSVAMRANDIGHLEGWPIHFLCNFRERFT